MFWETGSLAEIIEKHVLVGDKLYKIIPSTLKSKEYVSLYNEANGKFLRHKHGLLIESKVQDSDLFRHDSSFKPDFKKYQSKLISFSCSNKNLMAHFISLADSNRNRDKGLHISESKRGNITDFRVFGGNDPDLLVVVNNLLGSKVKRLEDLFKLHNPIANTPKAYGKLRAYQEDGIELLKFFDSLCRKYGLSYWIDYGTLLGAVRHKGFIPWDDDLDICMMGDDFSKFKEIIGKELENQPIEYRSNFPADIDKLFSKKRKGRNAWLDIFPFFYLRKDIDNQSFVRNFKKAEKEKADLTSRGDIERVKNFVLDFNNRHCSEREEETIFRGLQCPYPELLSTGDIFPLRELMFEGLSLYAPHNYPVNLRDRYGNFWNYPEDTAGHVWIDNASFLV